MAVSLLAAVAVALVAAVAAVNVAVVQTVAVAVVAAAVAVAVAALSLVGSEYFPSWQLYLVLVVGGTGSVCLVQFIETVLDHILLQIIYA